jgi:hypothetical protein
MVGNAEVGQKWDEQVFKIGETVSHEKDSAAPHRRSSEQTFPNRNDRRR